MGLIRWIPSFATGCDYVGKGAAADDQFVISTFVKFIEGWYYHLRTCSTHLMLDYPPQQSMQESFNKINDWNEVTFASFQ